MKRDGTAKNKGPSSPGATAEQNGGTSSTAGLSLQYAACAVEAMAQLARWAAVRAFDADSRMMAEPWPENRVEEKEFLVGRSIGIIWEWKVKFDREKQRVSATNDIDVTREDVRIVRQRHRLLEVYRREDKNPTMSDDERIKARCWALMIDSKQINNTDRAVVLSVSLNSDRGETSPGLAALELLWKHYDYSTDPEDREHDDRPLSERRLNALRSYFNKEYKAYRSAVRKDPDAYSEVYHRLSRRLRRHGHYVDQDGQPREDFEFFLGAYEIVMFNEPIMNEWLLEFLVGSCLDEQPDVTRKVVEAYTAIKGQKATAASAELVDEP